MLRFIPFPAARLDAARRKGLNLSKVSIVDTLEAAQTAGEGAILVVDADRMNGSTDRVPPEALLNLDPYLAPKPVTAAGGYVVRRRAGDLEVLLIFRRGVWDLPKGKLDDGEGIEACALREVREEIGIEDLTALGDLGTTLHTYPHKGALAVKTTYWFLMQTPETAFTPQAEEDIEAVEWVPWNEARERVGYATLRDHMDAIEATVRATIP